MSAGPGLCGACRHAQEVRTSRSAFWLCRRSAREPDRYRKYPVLPLVRCGGFEPQVPRSSQQTS